MDGYWQSVLGIFAKMLMPGRDPGGFIGSVADLSVVGAMLLFGVTGC